MKEACLRPKQEPAACPREEEQATCLRRQVERRDDLLQSAVGLSDPVPKAGLVRWAVKQLCPRPKEGPAACLQRGADRLDALAAGRACALAAASALAVWPQTAFAAVEPLAQSATCLARVTERASRDASRPMAVGRQPPPALRRVPMRLAGQEGRAAAGGGAAAGGEAWGGCADGTGFCWGGAAPAGGLAGFLAGGFGGVSPGFISGSIAWASKIADRPTIMASPLAGFSFMTAACAA